jgi:hypothetical protein
MSEVILNSVARKKRGVQEIMVAKLFSAILVNCVSGKRVSVHRLVHD